MAISKIYSTSGYELVDTITPSSNYTSAGTLYLYANKALRRCMLIGTLTFKARSANKAANVGSINSNYIPKYSVNNVLVFLDTNNTPVSLGTIGKTSNTASIVFSNISALEAGYFANVNLEWIY